MIHRPARFGFYFDGVGGVSARDLRAKRCAMAGAFGIVIDHPRGADKAFTLVAGILRRKTLTRTCLETVQFSLGARRRMLAACMVAPNLKCMRESSLSAIQIILRNATWLRHTRAGHDTRAWRPTEALLEPRTWASEAEWCRCPVLVTLDSALASKGRVSGDDRSRRTFGSALRAFPKLPVRHHGELAIIRRC